VKPLGSRCLRVYGLKLMGHPGKQSVMNPAETFILILIALLTMSVVDDIRAKWESMDEVDRKNFYIALIFVGLLIILYFTLSNTADSLGKLLGSGASYVNSSVQGVSKLPLGNTTVH